MSERQTTDPRIIDARVPPPRPCICPPFLNMDTRPGYLTPLVGAEALSASSPDQTPPPPPPSPEPLPTLLTIRLVGSYADAVRLFVSPDWCGAGGARGQPKATSAIVSFTGKRPSLTCRFKARDIVVYRKGLWGVESTLAVMGTEGPCGPPRFIDVVIACVAPICTSNPSGVAAKHT
eukprot:1187121-Prorocentrum_minimum.AAC.3